MPNAFCYGAPWGVVDEIHSSQSGQTTVNDTGGSTNDGRALFRRINFLSRLGVRLVNEIQSKIIVRPVIVYLDCLAR
jgi:hypothetical protein